MASIRCDKRIFWTRCHFHTDGDSFLIQKIHCKMFASSWRKVTYLSNVQVAKALDILGLVQ